MPGSQAHEMAISHTNSTYENATGLPEHASPEEVLRVLSDENKLTQAELSKLIQVDERSIRRWLKTTEPITIQPRYAESIDDLRHLRAVLGPSLSGVNFSRWLRARIGRLNGERPIDLIALGRYEQVLEAAEAFAAGSPE